MTNRDFELIAKALHEGIFDVKEWDLETSKGDVAEIVEHITSNLASALQTTNPRFDYDWFMAKCGVTSHD